VLWATAALRARHDPAQEHPFWEFITSYGHFVRLDPTLVGSGNAIHRGHAAVEIRGFLEAYFETGTEGVIWSVLDPGLPGYDGLHTLEDGDELHVLDGTGGILWEGVVRLDRYTGRLPRWPGGEPVQQAVLGLWVHGLQEGMDPEAWGRMFTEERRAILRHGVPRRWDSNPHPFSGPAEGLHARLTALPQTRAEELFRSALYPWLVFSSGGEWHSLARSWGLGMDETLALIGNPEPEQLKAWATYPRRSDKTLLPFSLPLLERLGLLFGLNAALLWGLPDAASRAAWLAAANPRVDGVPPLTLLLGGETEGIARVLQAARACLDRTGERT
jgi:hypothetical protein